MAGQTAEELKEALEHARCCVELMPDCPESYSRLAAAAQLAHRPGEAEAALRRGLKACPAGDEAAGLQRELEKLLQVFVGGASVVNVFMESAGLRELHLWRSVPPPPPHTSRAHPTPPTRPTHLPRRTTATRRRCAASCRARPPKTCATSRPRSASACTRPRRWPRCPATRSGRPSWAMSAPSGGQLSTAAREWGALHGDCGISCGSLKPACLLACLRAFPPSPGRPEHTRPRPRLLLAPPLAAGRPSAQKSTSACAHGSCARR